MFKLFLFYIFFYLIFCMYNLNFNYNKTIYNFEIKDLNSDLNYFFNEFFKPKIHSNFNIGSPNQIINLFFILDSELIFIFNNSNDNNFNYKISNTFSVEEKLYKFSLIDEINIEGFKCKDILNEFNDFNFIFVNESNEFEKFNNGLIGLKIVGAYQNEKDFNFLNKLKNMNIIKNRIFTIDYENNIIFFGNYLHEENKKYDIKNFYTCKLEFYGNYLDYSIMIDEVNFQNDVLKIKDEKYKFKFDINLNGIIAPNEIKTIYLNNFFHDLIEKGICKEIFYLEKTEFICEKKIKNYFKNFLNLNLYNKELNYTFILNSNDLFLKINNNKYLFLIFFEKIYNWKIGIPFLNKYKMTIDGEKKIIGFYFNKNENVTSNIFLYIIIFILLIIIGIICYKFRNIIINLPRKIRANELENIFEYKTYNNGDIKGDKLIVNENL